MKIKPIHVFAVAILIGFAMYAGILNIGLNTNLGQPTTTPTPFSPTTPTVPIVPGVTRDAAALQFTVQSYVTDASIATGNAFADVTKAQSRIFDLTTKQEQVTINSAPEQSTQFYATGDELIIHVSDDLDPTGGTDHYDRWYYVVLSEGSPVYVLTTSMLQAVQTDPKYKYNVIGVGATTGGSVKYTSGTTNYWDIGALKIMPRTTAANLDAYLIYGGTTMSSVTDGSSWDDTQAEQNSDVTLATHDEKLIIKLDLGAVNIGYGSSMLTVTQSGKLEERRAVAIFSTNATGISASKMAEKNWNRVADSTLTGEKAFYYVIPELMPAKGAKSVLNIEVPLDTSGATASTAYSAKVWIIDFQLLDNVAVGSVGTGIPTAYGMVGEYGIDAMIFARAYSTSSGLGTSQVLFGDYTTAA